MNKVLLLLMSIMTLSSCKKDENEPVFVETSIDISYLNSLGEDLLNSQTSDYFTESQINVYYLINGNKVKVYNENLSHPKSFFITKEKRNGLFFLRLFPYTSYNNVNGLDENNHSITYIKFNNSIEDKIECEFKRTEDNLSIECIRVWYNDSKVWESSMGERRITVNL